jgi:hypothetical protein
LRKKKHKTQKKTNKNAKHNEVMFCHAINLKKRIEMQYISIVVGSMRYSFVIEALTRLCEEEEEFGYVSDSSGYGTPSMWSASEGEDDTSSTWSASEDEDEELILPPFHYLEIVKTAIDNACMDDLGDVSCSTIEFENRRDYFEENIWFTLSEDVKQEFLDSAREELECRRNDEIDALAAEYAAEAEAEKDLIDADQMLAYRANFEMYVWKDWSEEKKLPYIKFATIAFMNYGADFMFTR